STGRSDLGRAGPWRAVVAVGGVGAGPGPWRAGPSAASHDGPMYVIAVTGLKGGVGKTSTAVNLAALSAEAGYRTLLWDLDPQGAATHCLDLKPKLKGGASRLIGGGRGGLERVARSTSIERLEVVPADASVREIDRVLSLSG